MSICILIFFLAILKNDAVIVKYMENADKETEC